MLSRQSTLDYNALTLALSRSVLSLSSLILILTPVPSSDAQRSHTRSHRKGSQSTATAGRGRVRFTSISHLPSRAPPLPSHYTPLTHLYYNHSLVIDQIYDSDYSHLRPAEDDLFSDEEGDPVDGAGAGGEQQRNGHEETNAKVRKVSFFLSSWVLLETTGEQSLKVRR